MCSAVEGQGVWYRKWKCGGQPPVTRRWQQPVDSNPLNLCLPASWEVSKEHSMGHSMAVQSKMGRWISSVKWVSIWPSDHTRWQKVDCLQPVTTSSVVGLRRNSIALLKVKLEQNKQGKKQRHEGTATVTVVISSQSEPHYCLNAREIITAEKCAPKIDEIHRKLWLDIQYRSTGRAQLFSLTISSYISKAKWMGLQSLPHLPYSSDLFCFLKPLSSFQGKGFQNQQDADFEENAFLSVESLQGKGLWIFMLLG